MALLRWLAALLVAAARAARVGAGRRPCDRDNDTDIITITG